MTDSSVPAGSSSSEEAGPSERPRPSRGGLPQRLTTRWPRGAQALAFGMIGLSGFLPNLAFLWLFTRLGLHYLPAEAIASQFAIAWNFLLTDRLLFRHRTTGTTAPARGQLGRFTAFLALGNADLLARTPLLALLAGPAALNLYLATTLTLVASFIARYLLTDRLIYRIKGATTPTPTPSQSTP